jgi:LPS export ABC transporter protein LptC
MEKKLRITWLLSAVACLLAVWVAVALWQRSGETTPPVPVSPGERVPTVAMEGMRATEFRQGVKRWDLTAERAEYDKKAEVTLLTGVSLTAMGRQPLGTVTLVAKKAEFLNASKNLRLPAGVAATGDRRLRFTAGKAVFSNASSLLTAGNHVRYEDEMLRVEGEEMVFNTETRELRLNRNVQALIHPRAVDR